MQAVVEAAEEERAPFIAGFNGGVLGHPARSKPEVLYYYSCFGAALERCPAPVSFLLDESDDFA
ncbi:MAG: hypothetical protein HY508_16015 [Acidobacteria bacterium]|nr:hypothetical protein [Acidobacteriota bacterium]